MITKEQLNNIYKDLHLYFLKTEKELYFPIVHTSRLASEFYNETLSVEELSKLYDAIREVFIIDGSHFNYSKKELDDKMNNLGKEFDQLIGMLKGSKELTKHTGDVKIPGEISEEDAKAIEKSIKAKKKRSSKSVTVKRKKV